MAPRTTTLAAAAVAATAAAAVGAWLLFRRRERRHPTIDGAGAGQTEARDASQPPPAAALARAGRPRPSSRPPGTARRPAWPLARLSFC